MKKTIALIISIILVVAIFASCAPPSEEAVATEDAAITDEETETDAIDIEEDDALAELDSSSNAGLPIDLRDPRCCKNGCGTRLNDATDPSCLGRFRGCYKCPKCQTQYIRTRDGKWEYCDVQINSKDPKCCKCGGDIKFWSVDYRSDRHKCTKCKQAYLHFWKGDFWYYA